jgi:hypothetical protein
LAGVPDRDYLHTGLLGVSEQSGGRAGRRVARFVEERHGPRLEPAPPIEL